MSEHDHDLHAAFPEHRAALVALKAGSERFRSLAARYHDLAEEIFALEAGLQAGSDERVEGLKKERLTLLDQVAALIGAQETAG